MESSHTFEHFKREFPQFWSFQMRAPIISSIQTDSSHTFDCLNREPSHFRAFRLRAPTLPASQGERSHTSRAFSSRPDANKANTKSQKHRQREPTCSKITEETRITEYKLRGGENGRVSPFPPALPNKNKESQPSNHQQNENNRKSNRI